MHNILILDKDTGWRAWVRASLGTADMKDIEAFEASEESIVGDMLAAENISLVLADSSQCQADGLDLIQTAREHSESTQVLLFVSSIDEKVEHRAGLWRLHNAYLVSKESAAPVIAEIIADLLKK